MVESRERIEQKKYARCYKSGNYKSGPGIYHVDEVFEYFKMQKGDTLNDYGCGNGTSTKRFQDKELNVLGIDITKEGLEEDIPFIEASLWRFPKIVTTSLYGFCCDVLEHLPTPKVDISLKNIFDYTALSAFFRISHVRDNNGGRIIGEPLHLTVKDYKWWWDKIIQFFEIRKFELLGDYSVWYVDSKK